MYYAYICFGTQTIMAISKLNDHQARLIWVSLDVQPYGCSNQYGNPSGHCLCTMGISFACWLDYNSTAIKNQAMKMSSIGWRIFWLIVQMTFACSIGYSRMFLGVHALNQVLYGFMLGIWFALTSEFFVKEPMMKLVDDLIFQKEARLSMLLYYSTATLVVTFIMQIINYIVVANQFVNPPEWS